MRPHHALLVLCGTLILFCSHRAVAAEPFEADTVDYQLARDATQPALEPAPPAVAGGGDPTPSPAGADEGELQLGEGRRLGWSEWIAAGGRCASVDFGPADRPRAPRKDELPSIEATVQIPVIFHVIYKETTTNGVTTRTGYVPRSQIDAQMSVLNAAYAGAGVFFTLRGVERVLQNTWFGMSMGSLQEQAAKAALAVDPAHVLNIYTAGPANNVLGWAYFPWSYPDSYFMHGLVILYSTLPGGSAKPYNKGATATHEIGHYLGLFHTFQNGCLSPGDYVSDTFDEASPAYGCPTYRDTCPTPGLDPVWDYMDYTNDACMTRFTAGQATRMRWGLATYKKGFASTALLASQPAGPAPIATPAASLQIVPNPFNPTTVISFRLDEAARVSLRLYDVAGREVAVLADGPMSEGEHRVVLEGRGLAGGVYFAELRAGELQSRQRLVLLK